MSIIVYGIKNCNTMKKTFDFLNEKGVDYDFVDYKKQKPSPELLKGFLEKTELDSLVNRKGMTYRKLSDEEKEASQKVETAIPLLVEKSSMIKRPVIIYPSGSLTLGFNEEEIGANL
ncbi:Spx/MgsR family RNA polymerase-binding regulatory protein [Algoriphagus sediminis]|uniref:Spx/MgsR family RNA polymerase-binding regulatory protein n=1 Tax=Algoriphagus sediminis TaxID=3057113 RepID=A0ABT7Y923_9BACT|nr:Spx/MgsR family RNA polymerase-binding regulatory protein [Algoriphagus sediminis]MDN3202739.1 Spx/MgsR family RNA polymerase-binding regulatory protein [Algoriphagus sediminis]